MTKKPTKLFGSFMGESGVDPKVRAGFVDGSVEIDKSLKPIGDKEIGDLMRQDKKVMSNVMSEVMETESDNSALDL